MSIQVVKYSGESVPFSEEKLRRSLSNTGAGEDTIDQVVDDLRSALYEGITTKEIYKKAHGLLKKKDYNKASRYQIKQAMVQLGPTGYPFELFIGELMKAKGYQVKVGVILQGKCVSHEVDVLAEMANELVMLECKFHNQNGYKTDVKVPLYIQSRFKDLEEIWKTQPEYRDKQMKGGVITNARLTQDAINYGRCVGLEMMSWDYPNGASLNQLITKYGVHPITSLQSLSKSEKQYLIDQEVVTAKRLSENRSLLDGLRLSPNRLKKVLSEMESLCE